MSHSDQLRASGVAPIFSPANNMRNTIIQFVLAALLVSIIGGFAGYYFFIKNKTNTTASESAARGDDSTASFTGQVGSTYQNISSDSSGTSTAEVGKRAPRLWHAVLTPIAGFGFGPGGASLYVADRATGNILRADPNTSTIQRLTNTLFPKVREALFSRGGDVVLRTTNDAGVVTTFAGTIATTTVITSTSTPNMLEGVYLPQNIVAIDSVNNQPLSKGLFFITRQTGGGAVAATSNWKGGAVKKVFTSPLYQWNAQFLADGRAVVTQAASDDVAGYSFIVGSTGVMKPLVVDTPGLSVRYHDTADAFLYSSSEGGTLTLYVKVGTTQTVRLPIETTADKCVWAPGAGLIAYCAVPNEKPATGFVASWYQGAAHTADVWWKIEAAGGTATRFFLPDTRTSFDVEDPQVDESGSYIGWRDAKDKSLWLLRVSE